MVLKSYSTLSYDYSYKKKNCQSTGLFILIKNFIWLRTGNNYFLGVSHCAKFYPLDLAGMVFTITMFHIYRMQKVATQDYYRVTQKNLLFIYLGFLAQPFMNQEGGEYLFNSSLPLPPASQKLRHQPSNSCRDLTPAHKVAARLEPGIFGFRAHVANH